MSVLQIALTLRTVADMPRLAAAFAKLSREDMTLSFSTNETTGRVVLAAMGERHLDIVVERLRREFGVEASVGRSTVVYKETLTQTADGEAKYVGHTANRHDYGHVKLRVFPGAPGSGYILENEVTGGAVPPKYIEAIYDGIRDSLALGVIAGHPIVDVRVVVIGGSYHDVHSSERAFRNAACLAFRDAARQAQPMRLEPIMRLSVTVPAECAHDIVAGLESRRGEVLSSQNCGGTIALIARAPLAELFAYDSDLRDKTMGRGAFAMSLEGYRACPSVEDGGEDRDSFVGAPLKPRPAPRASGVAVPEPKPDETVGQGPDSGSAFR